MGRQYPGLHTAHEAAPPPLHPRPSMPPLCACGWGGWEGGGAVGQGCKGSVHISVVSQLEGGSPKCTAPQPPHPTASLPWERVRLCMCGVCVFVVELVEGEGGRADNEKHCCCCSLTKRKESMPPFPFPKPPFHVLHLHLHQHKHKYRLVLALFF